MAHQKDSELAPLIDQVMTALMDELTDGFSVQQVEWALKVMHTTILPHELRFAVGETEDAKRARVAIILGDLKEALSGKSARERWRTILHLYYVARLMPLSDRAFGLAQERLDAGKSDDKLRASTVAVRDQVQKVVEELQRRAPQIARRLDSVVSETMVDCAYAAGEVDVMSLRLGAIYAHRRDADSTCPGCGAANPPDSRFCNKCGANMAG